MAFETQLAPTSFAAPVEEKGKGRGRPSLLGNSPEIREEIIGYVARGLGFGEACSLAGVSRQTMYQYMQVGAKDLRAGKESEESFFYLLIKKAEAGAELDALEKIAKAANIPAFWGAAAFYLERRYPDRYGKQDRLTVNSTSRIDVQTVNVQENIIDAHAREIISEFAKLTIPTESESVSAIPGSTGSLPDDGEVSIP